jgi:anaerobic selenocysteine-containing dehydrogenase
VVDPRKTETAMAATQHYAIRPKSDLVLLYGLANRLIEDGRLDRDYIDKHTSGFEAFAGYCLATYKEGTQELQEFRSTDPASMRRRSVA